MRKNTKVTAYIGDDRKFWFVVDSEEIARELVRLYLTENPDCYVRIEFPDQTVVAFIQPQIVEREQ